MWRPAEKLAYFVLIPALVVHDLYNADLASLPFSRMVIALLGAVVIVPWPCSRRTLQDTADAGLLRSRSPCPHFFW